MQTTQQTFSLQPSSGPSTVIAISPCQELTIKKEHDLVIVVIEDDSAAWKVEVIRDGMSMAENEVMTVIAEEETSPSNSPLTCLQRPGRMARSVTRSSRSYGKVSQCIKSVEDSKTKP
jgi:hypothetical protein